jgi:IS5 family transposase
MAVKRSGQMSFVEALMPAGVGRNDRLDRLLTLVKWYRFEKILAGLRDDGPGRPAYPPLVMFKALLLQSLYGLSDAELEEALLDRLSFRRFAGLGLEEATPDHTTLCRFRNRLVEAGLLDRLFAELERQLDNAGLILRRGTMLDATLIENTTPANVNDTTPAHALICGDEGQVMADAAYHTHARERELRARGIKPRLMRRPNKHHPVLPPRLKRLNLLISRRRAAVETTFATWKRRMGLDAIRYIGLAKAHGQVMLAAMAFNMRRWVTVAAA